MVVSSAFWEVFRSTGHVGAYILYKDYQEVETTEHSDQQEEKEAMV